MKSRDRLVFLVGLFAIAGLFLFGANNSKFDLSALNLWGGEPTGQMRMVGAIYYEENNLVDETGNIWEVDTDLDRDGYYLLWIDDNKTQDIKDDIILKIWQETY